jgi:MFS superfamily sulfate permease-like transporter
MSAEPPAGTRPARGANLVQDLSASIVVFLVALPLCLGVSIASGMPAAAGIITGIIGGLVVGTLAGCPLQVSGPAAGLTVLVFQVVHDPTLGAGMLGVIVLGAGLMQLAAGWFKLGQWFRAVSPAVIEGMLAGIGILLAVSQLHVMFDGDPQSGGLANLAALPQAFESVLFASEGGTSREAARIGIVTILALIFWQYCAPKKLKLVPAPLVAILAASAVYAGWRAWGGWPELRHVPMPDSLGEALRFPDWELLSRCLEGPVLATMATVAFIASAETLLCAAAVDAMHRGPRTKYDRELMAQGVGNMLCGLFGALPMTGVIVRSAANIEAGGKTRLSAIFHGVWMLLLIALVPFLLGYIPRAALAAILVVTGVKLVDWKSLRHLWGTSRSEVLIFSATLMTIVARDLLAGVVVGIVCSLVKLLYKFSYLNARLEEDAINGRTVLHLEGAATFIRLPYLANVLERVPSSAELHVRLEQLSYIDHACLNLLMEWEKQHQSMGGILAIDWDSLHSRFKSRPNRARPAVELDMEEVRRRPEQPERRRRKKRRVAR